MFAMFGVQLYLTRALFTRAAPSGVVSLELACTKTSAECVLEDWKAAAPSALDQARQSVWWDFPFIVSYVLVLVLGCLRSRQVLIDATEWSGWKGVSYLFILLAVVAGICDVAEDIGLFHSLNHGADDGWARFTCTSAYAKFGLILACMLFWFLR